MVNMPINTWGINALSNTKIPHGNAINNTARLVAGSIGTAVLVTLMTLIAASKLAGLEGTASGIAWAFAGSTVFMAVVLFLALFKVERRLKKN